MQHVLRVSRLDEENEFVLVHLSSSGSQPLDLSILATEGSAPYYASLTQRHVGQLRDAKHCEEAEWLAVLGWTLLQKMPDDDVKNLHQIELIASSVDEGSIVLTIRRKISKITHRLGSITLKHDESRDVELFDWTSTAAQAQASATARVHELEVELHSKDAIISTLQTQLDEFVTAKSDSDRQMLEKFQVLLNSKKLKIRDQQRLLATAKVDEAVAEQVQQSRQSHATRTKPQRGKRKAVESSPADEPELDEKPGAAGNVPNATNANEDDEETASERTAVTPDRTDEETSDEEAFQVQAPSTTKPPAGSIASTEGSKAKQDEPKELPPRRQLPTRQADTRGPTSQATSETIMDDEETDDEL